MRHCEDIGRHGAKLIRNGMNVLTHCNAGWLAFVDIGTATAPLYAAQAQGRKFHVYCDETRPRSQGATLTAWELAQQNISHQIIADNAAGHLMQRGEIDLVIVGSDRTLGRTGEVANKIGTYTKAVLAAAARHSVLRRHPALHHRLESEVAASTFRSKSGTRAKSLARGAWWQVRSPQSQAEVRRRVMCAWPIRPAARAIPAFDVTPPELITGIITPVGIFKPRELWKRRRELGLQIETDKREIKLARPKVELTSAHPVAG